MHKVHFSIRQVAKSCSFNRLNSQASVCCIHTLRRKLHSRLLRSFWELYPWFSESRPFRLHPIMKEEFILCPWLLPVFGVDYWWVYVYRLASMFKIQLFSLGQSFSLIRITFRFLQIAGGNRIVLICFERRSGSQFPEQKLHKIW